MPTATAVKVDVAANAVSKPMDAGDKQYDCESPEMGIK